MKKLVILTVVILAVILLTVIGCGVDTYTDTDAAINTSVNQEFVIVLNNPNPRVGNHWYESYNDKMLTLVDTTYSPDDESHPDLGGTLNYQFKALETGTTEVVFTYKTVTDRVIEKKVFNIDIE